MREVKRPGAVGAAPRPKGKTDLADRLPTTSPTHAAQVPPPRMDFAWLVFNHGHSGPPELRWLHRDRSGT